MRTLLALAFLCSTAAVAAANEPVFRLEYDLPIGQGQHLHVIEEGTVPALANPHRRVVILLPGPLLNILSLDTGVTGYDAGEILARAGYVSLAIEPLGTGQSTIPADGRSVNLDAITEAYVRAIDLVRLTHAVARVDVYGEGGMGGLVASKLAADASRVRTASQSAQLYRYPTDQTFATLLSPFFRALLDSLPTGYLVTDAATEAANVQNSPPAVVAALTATQPGSYPSGYAYDLVNAGLPTNPILDITGARVPGLLIEDDIDYAAVEPQDEQAMQADYGSVGGGHLQVVVIAGSSTHEPRLGATEGNGRGSPFWTALIDFLDAN
jgi:hypothetical protein